MTDECPECGRDHVARMTELLSELLDELLPDPVQQCDAVVRIMASIIAAAAPSNASAEEGCDAAHKSVRAVVRRMRTFMPDTGAGTH